MVQPGGEDGLRHVEEDEADSDAEKDVCEHAITLVRFLTNYSDFIIICHKSKGLNFFGSQ